MKALGAPPLVRWGAFVFLLGVLLLSSCNQKEPAVEPPFKHLVAKDAPELVLQIDYSGEMWQQKSDKSFVRKPSSEAIPVALKRVREVNGQILVCDPSRLWKVATGKLVRDFQPIPPRASATDIAPNGKYFISAGGGGGGSSGGAFLGLWQNADGKLLWRKTMLLERANGIEYSEAGFEWSTSLRFSRDGSHVLASSGLDEPPLALYQTQTGKQIWATKRIDTGNIGFENKDAVWSGDELYIATTSRQTDNYQLTQVQIVDATKGEKLYSWDVPSPDSALAWSGDNRFIALATSEGKVNINGDGEFSADKYVVQLRNPYKGELRHTLYGAKEIIGALQFSPDGSHLAGASHDGNIYIWSVYGGELLHTLRGHRAAVNDVIWTGDERVVSVGEDGATRFWNLKRGELVATAIIFQERGADDSNVYVERRKKGFGDGEFRQLPKSEWLLYTPDGFYAASPGAEKFIRWQVGTELFPVQKFKARMNQPFKVRAALRD